MYPLAPLKVYVVDRVYQDRRCVKRLERILNALAGNFEISEINDNNFPAAVEELKNLYPSRERPSKIPVSYTKPLVFTTMKLVGPGFDLKHLLKKCPSGILMSDLERIFGHFPRAIDQHPHMRDQENNCVCWPTYNFGTIAGCSHGCLYCSDGERGKFLSVALNLEEVMEKAVRPVIENNPWNRVFRMILNNADLITFEPEYGLFELFTETLSSYPDRYGYFHTSSSNVAWLANLKHRDRLIGVWSVSCETMAEKIESGTGKATDRFDAARLCQEMGIPVRFKFKPIIPVKDWKQEYAASIEYALKVAKPESVGFALYMWNTYDSLVSSLPVEFLDSECVDAAREAAAEMKGKVYGPFPHEIRKKIYQFFIQQARRHSKDVLLYVSTESREMWNDLKDQLGQDPNVYICGCGSLAIPGRKLAINPGLRYSTYHPTPI